MDERVQAVLAPFEGKPRDLIPMLQAVQTEFGYLPEPAMIGIAKAAGVPDSQVYAVATFYAQFRFTPIGRNHIMVCRGTACHVRGAPRILEGVQQELGVEEGQTTSDGEYSLETVACIGACGLAPCLTINKKVAAKMTPKKISKLLKRPSNADEDS